MFGIDDIGLALAGSALGGLLGGKGSKSTQQTRPYLPPEFDKTYTDTLLPDTKKLYGQPYPAPDMMRYSEASNSPFYSPVMGNIQQLSDNRFANNLVKPGTPAPPATDPQGIAALRAEMIGRDAMSDPISATRKMVNKGLGHSLGNFQRGAGNSGGTPEYYTALGKAINAPAGIDNADYGDFMKMLSGLLKGK